MKWTYNLSYRMTYNATDAEDLTQEIFLRLFQNLGRYDAAYPFHPWFRKLATNCAINWKERAANRAGRPLESAHEPSVSDSPPTDSSHRLRKAVQELPIEYQTCLTLKYLEDLGVSEIAESMGVPAGTVKTWLFRARDLLKDKLKPYVERLL